MDFQERLNLLSTAIHPFAESPGGDGVVFSEQAHALIDASVNASLILGNFAKSIQPGLWWGELADIIAIRRLPFDSLLQDDRVHVREAARAVVMNLRGIESRAREMERVIDQRFE